MNKFKIVALVPMRHSSERVLGKNYRSFAGKPLFFHIIESLIQSKFIETIIIDTKENEIKIGLTYNDIYEIGKLRFGENIGPESIFLKLYNDKKGKV